MGRKCGYLALMAGIAAVLKPPPCQRYQRILKKLPKPYSLLMNMANPCHSSCRRGADYNAAALEEFFIRNKNV